MILGVSGDGALPVRAHPGDAGMDLFVSETVTVAPSQFVDIHTGIGLVFPDGYWGRIVGRSSTFRRRGLLVIEGIIDHGYTGPVFVGVVNLRDRDVVVEQGDRIAQLILHRTIEVEVDRVESLPERGRGDRGFGSSGR